MAKFFGKIGYLQTAEKVPGVYSEEITEQSYYGDVLSYYIRPSEKGEGLNDNVRLNNKVSIVSDSFAMDNIGYMKYVVWGKTCWKITNVEVSYPRLILTLGEQYNGPTAETTRNPKQY